MDIGEFFGWWRTELTGMLPDGWRRRFERHHDTVLLSPMGDELQVSRRDNGRLEELGRIDMALPDAGARMAAILGRLKAGSTRVEVAVPPEKLLVKQIRLPLAAEENLGQVLGFEMQRQTPFRAEQVYFNYRITARPPQSQQLAVQISVVPRTMLEGILGPFVGWDLVPVHGNIDQDDLVFAFAPGDVGQRPSSRLHRVLLMLNFVLVVALVAIPLVPSLVVFQPVFS